MSNSEQMLQALSDQDLTLAEHYFELALKEDTPEELLALAEYLEQIGFLPQARDIYLKHLSDFPELAINLAKIAMEDGQVEEAFAYLDQIGPDSPHYLEALVTQADFYQLEGLADVAREKLLTAQDLSDDPLIDFGLAELEFELAHYKEAISLYAGLDNRDIYQQTGVSTYQRIGLAYANLGKFEAAIEFLEKAVELEYDDQTVFELAALLFDQGNYQRANIYFKQLETLNPDFEGHAVLYAQSLHAEHDIEGALAVLQRSLVKNEIDASLLLLASQYAYELKDTDLSENYLLQAKEWAEDLEEVDLRLSTLYLEQERYTDLVALDRPDIDHLLTRWQLAKGYQALEEEEKSLRIYADLATELDQNPDFLKEYTLLLYGQGDVGQACVYLNKYLALVPDDLEMTAFLEALGD